MGYFEDFEIIWRQNKKPWPSYPRQSRSLRGTALYNELARLSVVTNDNRFDAAMDALHEHRIIDEDLNYTNRRPPKEQRFHDDYAAGVVELVNLALKAQQLRGSKVSKRKAFAEIAACLGHPGNSFDAAVKDIEKLFGKQAPHQLSNQ